MSSTDELRRLLDERGVEWKDYGYENHTWWSGGENVGWHAENRPSVRGLYVKIEAVLTTEQAIVATLGVGTCHDKGNIERFICSECGCRLDMQDEDWEPTMWLDDGAATVPRFCPNCGARVEGE